jgi:small subunit ribosomal protein S15
MADYLTAQKKQEIFGQYGTSNKDTGSAESQVALFLTVSPILPNT